MVDRTNSGKATSTSVRPDAASSHVSHDKFWQDWEVTSDDDVERDTLSESKQQLLRDRYL